MKGNDKIIKALNRALTIELTAINQYFIQAKMLDNWGYKELAETQKKESIEEMKHADTVIERILFLEGTPNIASYDTIRVGGDVRTQFVNDLKLETAGAQHYNKSIDLCLKEKDAVSRELMEHVLVDTEEHIDWLETQIGLIDSIGLENYLAEKLGK